MKNEECHSSCYHLLVVLSEMLGVSRMVQLMSVWHLQVIGAFPLPWRDYVGSFPVRAELSQLGPNLNDLIMVIVSSSPSKPHASQSIKNVLSWFYLHSIKSLLKFISHKLTFLKHIFFNKYKILSWFKKILRVNYILDP